MRIVVPEEELLQLLHLKAGLERKSHPMGRGHNRLVHHGAEIAILGVEKISTGYDAGCGRKVKQVFPTHKDRVLQETLSQVRYHHLEDALIGV
eukprot:4516416-Prorocentrum_lima.AAC.1